jgi:hypothetical protein
VTAVTEDAVAWGAGVYSQLWLTSFEHRHTPTSVGGLEMFATRFVMLAAGFLHWAALAAGDVGSRQLWGPGPRRRADEIYADENGQEGV